LDEILPYLARIVPNATYNATDGWVSFKKGQKIITIYKDGFVTLTMIKDEEEALNILQELEKKIKLAWENRHEINEEKSLKDCNLLFGDSKYIGIREALINLLLSSGYKLEV
jgi:ArsR family metal-binding transcriptional regulator